MDQRARTGSSGIMENLIGPWFHGDLLKEVSDIGRLHSIVGIFDGKIRIKDVIRAEIPQLPL